MNCKPGDLAIVVNAARTPEMIGHLVTVLFWVGEGDACPDGMKPDGAAWWCKSENSGGIPTRHPYGLVYEPERLIDDQLLRPIRPGDLEDETPTVRELEAA